MFRLPFLILQIWDFYDLGISRAHGVNLKDFSAECKSKLGMFNVCHLRQQHQLQDLFKQPCPGNHNCPDDNFLCCYIKNIIDAINSPTGRPNSRPRETLWNRRRTLTKTGSSSASYHVFLSENYDKNDSIFSVI